MDRQTKPQRSGWGSAETISGQPRQRQHTTFPGWCFCGECAHEWLPHENDFIAPVCLGCYLNDKQISAHHATVVQL